MSSFVSEAFISLAFVAAQIPYLLNPHCGVALSLPAAQKTAILLGYRMAVWSGGRRERANFLMPGQAQPFILIGTVG